MAGAIYSKEFSNLSAALAFGREVDFITQQEGALVPTGKKRSRLKCYLGKPFVPEESRSEYEHIGVFHTVEKDPRRDVYRVEYVRAYLSDFWRADQLKAERFVTEYLDQKYRELNPNAGLSRA